MSTTRAVVFAYHDVGVRCLQVLLSAGVEVPLTLYREGVTFDVRMNSSDRAKFLKGPRMH